MASMELCRIIDEGPFRTPALVVALDGWVNAGQAATIAGAEMAGDGRLVAEFSADDLIDYRQSRPMVEFVDGVIDEVTWPGLAVRLHAGTKRDVLIMSGIEPNWNWRRLAAATVEMARRMGVVEHISIGGVPWAAPHTRPVSLMVTTTSPEYPPGDWDRLPGTMRVPAAATSILEHAMAEAGFPTIGFWARVPSYSGSVYPAAALALLQRLSEHLDEGFSVDDLTTAAVDQRIEIDAIVDARPELHRMVEEYEMVHDTGAGISGDAIAAEIERFLRGETP